VRIDRLGLSAFGRFHDRVLELKPGFNIIYGENEAGKTTVQKFILGMLYGFKKRAQRRDYAEDVFRYRPWEGTQYRGSLSYTLQRAGRTYRVERQFEPSREDIRIYDDVTGADLTGRFGMDRRKELLFMEEQLNLPEEVFRSTAWVGQLEVGKLEMGRELVTRVANMQDSGREDLSVKTALRLLEDRVREIGSDRAPTRPYARVTRLIEERRQELERAATAQEQTRSWEGALTEVRAVLVEIDAELEDLGRRLAWAALREAEARVEQVQGSSRSAQGARERADALSRFAAFPGELREPLARAQAEAAAANRLAAQQQERLADLQAQADHLRQQLARFARLQAMGQQVAAQIEMVHEADRMAELHLPALQVEAHQIQDLITRLDETIEPLKPAAEKGSGILSHVEGVDREIASLRPRMDGENLDHLRLEVSQQERAYGAAGGWAWLGLAVVAALMAAASPFAIPQLGAPAAFIWPAVTSAAAVAVGAAAAFFYARRKAGHLAEDVRRSKANLKTVQERVNQYQERLLMLERDKDRALHTLGVSITSEIRTRVVRYEQLMARRDGQRLRLDHVESEVRRTQAENRERWQALHRSIGEGLGLSEAEVAALPDPIGTFRTALAAYQDLARQVESLAWESAEVVRRHSEQVSTAERCRGDAAAIFASAGVADAEAFGHGCTQRDAWAQALLEAQTLETALRSQLGGETLESLAAQADWARAQVTGTAPDDTESTARLQAEIRRLEARRAELQSRAADLAARVETALRSLPDTADLRREVEALGEERRAMSEELAALDLAARTIAEVSAEIHREFAPKLNSAMGDVVSALTRGKYRDVRIDEAMTIRAIAGGNRTVDLLSLSAGTVDQFYFGLRLALLDIITEGKESVPLILDDPFVQYDENRLRASMDFITSASRERQVLLMTCHQREVRTAREMGPPVNVIDISDAWVGGPTA